MKKVLEDLIFLGSYSEIIEFYGKKWELKTLSSGEQLEATSATGNLDTFSRIYALKLEILGRALKSVDGIKLDDPKETLEAVRKMQPPVINRLFEEYEKIQVKQDDSLKDVEEIKN